MREYIKAARDEADKSRCDRAHVGCVIVDRATGKVVSRAFNETPHGLEPCDTGGHRIVDDHCVNTVHAERNAIRKMAEHGSEYTLYVTHYPCQGCAHLISSCPEIMEVVYLGDYNNSQEATALLSNLSEGCHHAE
nr:MAG TPA: deoxycytidylate deaminase [Caudoviricetes sp.]